MRFEELKTPVYVIDEKKLIHNLEILHSVEEHTGCHILLAQKAFSAYAEYPLIGNYISGTTASGIYEAKLGAEYMDGENHVFAPAFTKEDMQELVKICDHVVFNSVFQLKMHKQICLDAGVSFGLRVNPEFSTQGEHAIYDPCAPGSRLGVTLDKLLLALDAEPDVLNGIEGIHFHTLCEQNSDDLEATLEVVEEKFGFLMKGMKWVNFGGGHHITRDDYDIDTLEKCINHVKDTYDVEVYVEPGEAVALNAGYLQTSVLDKVDNGISTLILDASAACHMPDVLEMPYTPPLYGGIKISDIGEDIWKPADSGKYRYRLSSYTCLAGDIIGDYEFDYEINVGDRLVFEDMAIYSMVKNNTFNGIPLPDIAIMDEDGSCRVWKHFSYEDFKGRL